MGEIIAMVENGVVDMISDMIWWSLGLEDALLYSAENCVGVQGGCSAEAAHRMLSSVVRIVVKVVVLCEDGERARTSISM